MVFGQVFPLSCQESFSSLDEVFPLPFASAQYLVSLRLNRYLAPKMISMSRLEDALRFNNEGVSLLLSAKDTNKACMRFKESLTIFQQILLENQTIKSTADSTCLLSSEIVDDATKGPILRGTNNCSSAQNKSRRMNEESIEFTTSTTVEIPYIQNDRFFVYSKAITFNSVKILSSSFLSQQNNHKEIRLFIATVLLNIALTYHREVILGKKKLIVKAKAMYETITRMLMDQQQTGLRHHGGLDFFILLAATNNLSTMLHEEGEFDDSADGFQRLTFLLTKRLDDESFILHGVDYSDVVEGIRLNIILARTQPTAACAA